MSEKTYYTIAVAYKKTMLDDPAQAPGLEGQELAYYRLQNMTGAALRNFRRDIFIDGLLIWRDADTGYIVPPWMIRHVEVYRQAHFFKPADLGKNLARAKDQT